jgi:hypothetical protein
MTRSLSDTGGTLTVEHNGDTVIFTLVCRDEYAAMIVYDAATDSLQRGGNFSLTVSGASPTGHQR